MYTYVYILGVLCGLPDELPAEAMGAAISCFEGAQAIKIPRTRFAPATSLHSRPKRSQGSLKKGVQGSFKGAWS